MQVTPYRYAVRALTPQPQTLIVETTGWIEGVETAGLGIARKGPAQEQRPVARAHPVPEGGRAARGVLPGSSGGRARDPARPDGFARAHACWMSSLGETGRPAPRDSLPSSRDGRRLGGRNVQARRLEVGRSSSISTSRRAARCRISTAGRVESTCARLATSCGRRVQAEVRDALKPPTGWSSSISTGPWSIRSATSRRR